MARRTEHATGPSQRQLRVGELIRRTLAEVLAQGDLHDPDLAGMSITVGEVRASPDLKVATVFVMPLGGKGAEAAIAALARNARELRRLLAREVTLRAVPELRFRIDDTFDRLDETRRLFSAPVVARDVAAGRDDGEAGDEDEA